MAGEADETEVKPAAIGAWLKEEDHNARSDWGNKLVVNTGRNPVVNFSFMLRVEGVFDLPCKSVKGIQRENEFDYIQEGGLNDYVHLKRKAISKPFTFQVERYVGINWVDPLPLGTELVLPIILFVNRDCFPKFKPVRNYVFTGCTVISKDYGELNAEVSGLLMETVTIAYREMVCMDIPMDALEDSDVWQFDGTKTGKGDRNYNSNIFNKEWETDFNSKSQMIERAKKYTHSKTAKQYLFAEHNEEVSLADKITAADSNKYVHSSTAKQYKAANYDKSELSASDMEKKGFRWTPNPDEGTEAKNYGKDFGRYATDFNKEIDAQIEAADSEEEKSALKSQKLGGSASRQYTHSAAPKQYSSAEHNAEVSLAEKIAAADSNKYVHSSTAKQYKAANYDKSEPSRSTMEEKARLWPKTRSAKQITDFLKK